MAQRFGNYTLLHRLAQGGMGDVFVAQHGEIAGMEKLCVIKRLRPQLADDRAFLERFKDEARLVVQLSHRNIAQVFDVGQVGEHFYLGMELIAGLDARELLARKALGDARLVEAIALFIVGEVLEGLSYAHRRTDPISGEDLAIVHRDISPQNVMASFEGEVKIVDFGLAKSRRQRPEAPTDSKPRKVFGKLAYMSPEQARGDTVDARTDVFATAVLALELVSGRRFYEGLDHQAIWNVAGKGGHRPEAWSFLHKGLQRVLDRALDPVADRRYPTAEAFKEALDGYVFARGHRSSPRELRELLERDCADAIEAHRALLITVSDAQAQAAGEPAPPVSEPTRVIATAGVTTSGPVARGGPADSEAPTAPLPTLVGQRSSPAAAPTAPAETTGGEPTLAAGDDEDDEASKAGDRTFMWIAAAAGAGFLLLLLALLGYLALS